MYQIRRVTTEPNAVMRVLVDHVQGDGDGGFAAGGSFFFAPAGQEGDRHQANGHAARVIMGDPGLAPHFECTPPLDGQAPAAKPAAAPKAATSTAGSEPASSPATATKARKGRKAQAGTE